MFPAWRLQIREARLAVADGRWDDAAEMLSSRSLRQYLPAKRLSMQLAEHLVQRARQRIDGGESSAGWRDLDQAALLGGDDGAIGEIRQSETQQRLGEAIRLLENGDPAAALARLRHMERRGLGGEVRRQWEQVAQLLLEVEKLAQKGDFAAAERRLVGIESRLPTATSPAFFDRLAAQREQYREHASRLAELEPQLHAFVVAGNWTEALATADAMLRLAPNHTAARQSRRRAWKAVGMEATRAYVPSRPIADFVSLRNGNDRGRQLISTRRQAASPKEDTVSLNRSPGKRLVTWIDAVGGFMICLGDEIVLGQPSADGGVDVPLLADLSRRHATIHREGESYVLHPIHKVSVNGVATTGPVVLQDKSVLSLGDAVKLRFRRPHALSATALLEFMTHHKTEPAVDGVVLMSDSCIMGAQSHSHIRCRDWEHEVVLFRRGEKLFCRTRATAEFNGAPMPAQVELRGDCRIEGEDFALSFEEI